MATKTNEELEEMILLRLYLWVQRISGKPITSKQSEQIKEIVRQVFEQRNLKNKK